MDVPRRDLAFLAAALGRTDRTTFIRMLATATILGHRVDVQVVDKGRDFAAFVTSMRGDAITAYAELPVPWPEDEVLQLALLRLRMGTILDAVERWRAR